MKKVFHIKRERAVEIAMVHNMVTREVAERYSDSELKEVLRHLSTRLMTFKLK